MTNETNESMPMRHRTKKHKPRLSKDQKDAKDITKREHDSARKREEERLKLDEEMAHREEERQHELEEERHRVDEERRHTDKDREDEYRKKHETEMEEIYPSYHDIESDTHAKRDPYISRGAEYEDEDYGKELPCHHTFSEDEFDKKDNEMVDEHHEDKEHTTTPLFLAAAANMYLDTTVTKFL